MNPPVDLPAASRRLLPQPGPQPRRGPFTKPRARQLRAMSRTALRAAVGIDPALASSRWAQALAVPGARREEPARVALLDDWSTFSGRPFGDAAVERPALRAALERDATGAAARWGAAVSALFETAGASRVLVAPSSIGSLALLVAHDGFSVVLADGPDMTSHFAAWRLERRGHRPAAGGSLPTLDLPRDAVDAIVTGRLDGAVVSQFDRVLATDGVIVAADAVGPAIALLHARRYRIAHARTVGWLAQKSPLPSAEHARQTRALALRALASRR